MNTFKFALLFRRFGSVNSRLIPLSTSCFKRMASVNKSDEEWKKILTPEQYEVARQKGTEKPWTGDLLDNKAPGTYKCACCGAELFESDAKFDSGSGWPSFHTAKNAQGRDDSKANVEQREDVSHGMKRVEVVCKNCDAHLGHVFEDGPNPSGLRYCINSVCMKFQEKS